ncbi:hypothetical protein RRG08_001349 [Elysia crispata]|uniref:Uncharacterized protein n=1 Tax=Elysia crispata TaxID=231223 RepID=A0AAE1E0X5_9GAST|nr:hypothetical protein RRG08_001349 [Elysia crispata]
MYFQFKTWMWLYDSQVHNKQPLQQEHHAFQSMDVAYDGQAHVCSLYSTETIYISKYGCGYMTVKPMYVASTAQRLCIFQSMDVAI